MKRPLLLTGAALCAAVASAAPMKFLSFNVWGDYFKNPVNEREAAIESTIRKYSPDVAALQEMTPAWWESPMLGNLSTEYGVEGDVIREYDVLQIVWRIAEIRHSSGTDRKPKKLKARSVLFCLSNVIQSKGV